MRHYTSTEGELMRRIDRIEVLAMTLIRVGLEQFPDEITDEVLRAMMKGAYRDASIIVEFFEEQRNLALNSLADVPEGA